MIPDDIRIGLSLAIESGSLAVLVQSYVDISRIFQVLLKVFKVIPTFQ